MSSPHAFGSCSHLAWLKMKRRLNDVITAWLFGRHAPTSSAYLHYSPGPHFVYSGITDYLNVSTVKVKAVWQTVVTCTLDDGYLVTDYVLSVAVVQRWSAHSRGTQRSRNVSKSACCSKQRRLYCSAGSCTGASSATQRAPALPRELYHGGPRAASHHPGPRPTLSLRSPVWRDMLSRGRLFGVCAAARRCLFPRFQCYGLCLRTDGVGQDVHNRRSQYL